MEVGGVKRGREAVEDYDGSQRGKRVRKSVALVLTIGVLAVVCRAEARWCAVAGLGSGQNLVYPPIARAAYVHGVVLERVIYLPNGAVQSFEFISGPRMLSAGLEQQMRDWTIKTNQSGEQACVILVIAEFNLDKSSGQSTSYPVDMSVSSILRIETTAEPVCLCDPGGYVSPRPLLQRVGHAIRRMLTRLSGVGS